MVQKEKDKTEETARGHNYDRKSYNVPWDEFVRAWETSDTAEEVVEKTGMPYGIVMSRASFYRRSGVKLKKFKRAKNKNDVEAMNRLVEQIRANKEKAAKK